MSDPEFSQLFNSQAENHAALQKVVVQLTEVLQGVMQQVQFLAARIEMLEKQVRQLPKANSDTPNGQGH